MLRDLVERRYQLGHRLVARFALLRERLHDRELERLGDREIRPDLARWHDRIEHLHRDRAHGAVAPVRCPADHQLVQDRAERVDIDATIGIAATRSLLRRHVLRRAEHRADPREARTLRAAFERLHLRDPEIDDLDEVDPFITIDEEHVLGFEIAMDDALVVRGAERTADLLRDRDRLLGGHRCAVLDRARQRDAVDVLHHRVGHAVGRGAEIGDVDDVRVANSRCRLRLLDEALDRRGVAHDLALEHLDRERALDHGVARGEHHAHAALADLALDEVAAIERLADQPIIFARGRLASHRLDDARVRALRRHRPELVRRVTDPALGRRSIRDRVGQ